MQSDFCPICSPTKAIKVDANDAGYAWATIRRAQSVLGIEARKAGMKGGWEWALLRRCSENPEDAQQKVLSIFGKIPATLLPPPIRI